MTGGPKLGLAGLLTLGLAISAGCDDGGGSGGEDLRVTFVTPKVDESLGCGQDQDKSTPDAIDLDVEVLVTLSGVSTDGLTARLLVGGEPLSEPRAVLASGRVIFGDIALPLGSLELVAEISRDGTVVGTSSRTITTSFDTEAAECKAFIAPTVSFQSPSAGMVFDADGVADLSADLLFDATIVIDGDFEGDARITVGGADGGTALIDLSGKAVFTDLRLPTGDGSETVQLVATVTGEDGVEYSSSIDLVVDISGCTLAVSPMPGGELCDLSGADDVDPETDGIQIELSAESNCSEVIFTVNGAALDPVAVADGSASRTITLNVGANTLSAAASTPGGITGSADEYGLTLAAGTAVVGLELDELGTNTWNLTSPSFLVRGTAEGLSGDVSITFDPPLEGAPASATIADGAVEFQLPQAPFYCGTVTVAGADECGAAISSASYEICIDTVQPVLTIVAPADGTVISPADDLDEGTDGVQLSWQISVDDPRPELDYEIVVECARELPDFVEKSDAPIARSALVDGEGIVQITLDGNDEGTIICRAFTGDSPNEAIAETRTFRFVFDTPIFTLSEPRVGESPQCFGGEVAVGGQGVSLDNNGAALQVSIVDDEGAEQANVPLAARGGDAYSTVFGAEGGPEALADGAYRANVTGEIVGGLAVIVGPIVEGGIPFIVDTTAPTFDLVAPALDAPLGIDADTNADLSDCVQTALELRLTDTTTERLCYSINGSEPRCGDAVDGVWTTPMVTLLDGDNSVMLSAIDCSGNEGSAEYTIQTVGCPERIQIISPNDGAQLAVAADAAPDAGYQIDVVLDTALAEGTELEVVVDDGAVFSGVADANGDVTIRVTVEHPADQADDLSFTLQGRTADGSNTGPQTTSTIRFQQPVLTLTPFDGCLNREVLDAEVGGGFEIVVQGTTERVALGQIATLTADCDGELTQSEGAVGADGAIRFAPLTVSEEATCTLSAQVADAADQMAESAVDVTIDRVAPTLTYVLPAPGGTITALNDEDRRELAEANGIQITPRIEVCGAAGQTLSVTASPAVLGDGPLALEVGDGACSGTSLGQHTLPSGSIEFSGTVTDVCGNTTTASNVFTVDTDASLRIIDPADQTTVQVTDDLEPETAGCQVRLHAVALGLAVEAEIEVCTDFDQGGASDICSGNSRAGRCAAQGEEGLDVFCDVSLEEGVHTLTVVGRFGGDTVSDPATVRVDCTSPTIESVVVAEVGDDACVNRKERINSSANADSAQVTIRVSTTGLEDEQSLAIRVRPGDQALTFGSVEAGEIEAVVTLAPGAYSLYVTGADLAGNPVAGPDGGGVLTNFRVDTVAATPNVLNVAANSCLNGAAADADGAAGLQYVIQAQTGAAGGEQLTVALAVDGVAASMVQSDADTVDFDAANLPEGARSVAVTTMDGCGNVGSANGFAQLDGEDDWANPQGISFRVDTVDPVLTLAGVADGAVLVEADDADANAANGFQLDLTTVAAGAEAGQAIRLMAGAQEVATSPNPFLSIGNGRALPVTITLPPGQAALTAESTDTCGNTGRSATTNVTVDINGCASRLIGFNGPVIYGPSDGVQAGDALQIDVNGTVDLLNPACAAGTAQLVLDNAPIGVAIAVGDGNVSFADVQIPSGAHSLALVVVEGQTSTSSPLQSITIDLASPVVEITSPTGAEPVVVLGAAVTVNVTLTEAAVSSDRSVTLSVDGAQVGSQDIAGQDVSTAVNFVGVAVAAGVRTLEVCATDGAGNSGCDSVQINIDPAAPGAFDPLPTIVDARLTRVNFTFVAPGDDGAAGSVNHYEVRRSSTAFVGEADWETAAADVVATFQPGAGVNAGDEEVLTIDGLRLNARHFIAVRGVDEVGQLSALTSKEVDLRMSTQDFELTGNGGLPFGSDDFSNGGSLTTALGDMDNDGFEDVLVAATDVTGVHIAAVVFGGDAASPAEVVYLDTPPGTNALFYGFAGSAADVNGDGFSDALVLGYSADFGSSVVGIYFGCDGCDRAQIAAPDSRIVVGGGPNFSEVGGIGNFTALNGDAAPFEEVAIGGSPTGNPFGVIVAGRAVWPAVVDASVANAATGIFHFDTGLGRDGRAIATGGDLDGDGRTEMIFSAAGIHETFIFYGSDNFGDTISYDANSAATVQLVPPCPDGSGEETFGWTIAGGVDLDGDPGAMPDFVVSDRRSKRLVAFDQDGQNLDCVRGGQTQFGGIFSIIGDIDGDGDIDLAASHREKVEQVAWIYYNDGAGHFGIGEGDAVPRGANVDLGQLGANPLGVVGVGRFDGGNTPDVATIGKLPGGNLQLRVFK